MMSKNIGLGFALFALFVIALWMYPFKNSQLQAPPSERTTPTTTPEKSPETNSASPTSPKPAAPKPAATAEFKSVLAQKGNYQCDYDQVQSTGQKHNVIYISNGKMRAEFRSISGDVTATTISVYDGRYLYTWKEGFSTGTRSTITSLGQLPAAIPADLTSGKIYGNTYESVGWKCRVWLVDSKLLAPPSYVKFQ
jgi:hypothetical protein